jgi:hypothetical protein
MYLSRGVLMLDEDLLPLKEPLEQRNFIVGAVPFSTPTSQMSALLAHRVFITNNSENFLEPAVIREFSLIDTKDATQDPEKLADIISKEWLAGSLKMRQPFLARISANGAVTVNAIEG